MPRLFSSCSPCCLASQAAISYPKTHSISQGRENVWMLAGGVAINPTCWQGQNITFPTQLYGQQLCSDASNKGCAPALATDVLLQSQRAQDAAGPTASSSSTTAADSTAPAQPLANTYELSFGYMRSALQLPADAQENFLQIQNVVLQQLPQGLQAGSAATMMAGDNQDVATPPDIWTILLWSVKRYVLPLCRSCEACKML